MRKKFGDEMAAETLNNAKKFLDRGWMENAGDRLVLTEEGKLFADGIAAELFQESLSTPIPR